MSLLTDFGLGVLLDSVFGIGSLNQIDAMGVSNFGAIQADTISINAAGNKLVKTFDSTPTRLDNVVTCMCTFATNEANFTINTITLSNNGANDYGGIVGGVDGQAITKTSDFSLKITMKIIVSNG